MSFYFAYEGPADRNPFHDRSTASNFTHNKCCETLHKCCETLRFQPKIGVGSANLLPFFDSALGSLESVSVAFRLVGEVVCSATVDRMLPVTTMVTKDVNLTLTSPLHPIISTKPVTFSFNSFVCAPPPNVSGVPRNLIEEVHRFDLCGSGHFFDAPSLLKMTQSNPFPLAEFRFDFDDLNLFEKFPEIEGNTVPTIFRGKSSLSVTYHYAGSDSGKCPLDASLSSLFDVNT